jgi:hypothetical protein
LDFVSQSHGASSKFYDAGRPGAPGRTFAGFEWKVIRFSIRQRRVSGRSSGSFTRSIGRPRQRNRFRWLGEKVPAIAALQITFTDLHPAGAIYSKAFGVSQTAQWGHVQLGSDGPWHAAS